MQTSQQAAELHAGLIQHAGLRQFERLSSPSHPIHTYIWRGSTGTRQRLPASSAPHFRDSATPCPGPPSSSLAALAKASRTDPYMHKCCWQCGLHTYFSRTESKANKAGPRRSRRQTSSCRRSVSVQAPRSKMPPKPIDYYRRPFFKSTLERHEIQVRKATDRGRRGGSAAPDAVIALVGRISEVRLRRRGAPAVPRRRGGVELAARRLDHRHTQSGRRKGGRVDAMASGPKPNSPSGVAAVPPMPLPELPKLGPDELCAVRRTTG
eukprot:356295-Chlamydomonas_euryale.AAC.13